MVVTLIQCKQCRVWLAHLRSFPRRSTPPLKKFPGSQPTLLCYQVWGVRAHTGHVTTLDLYSLVPNWSAFGSLIPLVGSPRGSLRSQISTPHTNIEMKRFKNTKEALRRRRLRRGEWGGSCSGFSSFCASLKDVVGTNHKPKNTHTHTVRCHPISPQTI